MTANDLKTARSSYRPPLPDEMLLSADFFDLYPLDGGGALVTPEIVSSVRDAEFAEQVLEQDALRDFGALPRLDYRRFERWRTVQKSCWVNRFYWLVPLAKRCALTGDKALARLVVAAMLHFIETCPAPADEAEALSHMKEVYHLRDNVYNQSSFEEIQRDDTDIRYVWFDFEPASRLIHWLHALHFLEMGGGLGAEERAKIVESLYRNAEVIFWGEHCLRPLRPRDNHQSLRGVALLHAGSFFRGAGAWREFLEEGAKIINFHSRESFFPDGALKEISPSYHIFQTWHVRDAHVLAARHGLHLDAGVASGLAKHAAFLKAATDGGGETVVLEDGYPVRTAPFLASLGAPATPASAEEREFFPNAGISVLRREGLFLLFDASPFTGRASHYHAGKNAVVLWVCGKPFLVDSGCCSYDDELFTKWYRLGQAHSTLLVDGQGDGHLRAFCDFASNADPRPSGWSDAPDGACMTGSVLTSSASAWEGVVWSRTLRVARLGEVEIVDRVESSREVELSFIFNLHPDVIPELETGRALLRNGSVELRMTWQCRVPVSVETRKGKVFRDFRHCENRQVWIHAAGRGVAEIRTRIDRQ